jgi:hypothetical protein
MLDFRLRIVPRPLVGALLFISIFGGLPLPCNAESDDLYQACFSSAAPGMLEPSKFTMYALLVSKNGQQGGSTSARDYVTGRFSAAMTSSPLPADIAFHEAAKDISSTFSASDANALIEGCKADPKGLTGIPPELKRRVLALVNQFQLRAMAKVVEATQSELDRRGLRSPFN